MAGCPLFCCELPMSVKGKIVAVGCALLLLAGCAHWFVGRHVNIAWRAAAQDEKAILAGLKLPPGYAVDFFAPPGFGGLDAPRQLSLGDDGWIFSGSRAGKVYALRDTDGDGRADEFALSPRAETFATASPIIKTICIWARLTAFMRWTTFAASWRRAASCLRRGC